MILEKLVQNLGVKKVVGDLSVDVTGISYDSRKVSSGDIFVAIKGLNADGHRFIPEAVLAGAVAVVLENDDVVDDDYFTDRNVAKIVVSDSRKALAVLSSAFYGFPSKKLKLIGVTGTNGKTTTTHLIRSIAELAEGKAGLIGTISYFVGDKIIPANQTTPEAVEINRFLKEMLDAGVKVCVMEVSSHALSLDRVYSLDFDIGIFTNLTHDHLDFHGTFEAYLQAKKTLFDSLKKDAFAIYNIDDPNGDKMVSETKAIKVSYGRSSDAYVRAIRESFSFEGTYVEIETRKGRRVGINSSLIGEFNIYNILAAAAAGFALGYDEDVIKQGIEKVKLVKGRFEKIDSPFGYTVIIDYSHTPDALEKCIDSILKLKSKKGGKLITVFGCGGDRDKEKRPVMGKIASRKSDITIITSDNPRFEDPNAIIDEIVKGVDKSSVYYIFVDRKEAIERALEMASTGDVVLIAGKGHEEYQIIKDEKIPFSDREVVEKYFKAKLKTA